MRNSDTRAAWTYHNATKHALERVRSSRHSLDWPNQPLPFKIYTTLEPLPLPREFVPSGAPAPGHRCWLVRTTRVLLKG